MSDLAGMDTEAITEAVETLREADFQINEITNIERDGGCVTFDMTVEKNTRNKGL